MAPVLDAVRSREDRRTTLQARLAELEDGRAFSPADAEQLERQVKERVGDWRALLRGAPQEARQVLRALIRERVTFTPTGTGRQFAHDLQQQPCKNQVSH